MGDRDRQAMQEYEESLRELAQILDEPEEDDAPRGNMTVGEPEVIKRPRGTLEPLLDNRPHLGGSKAAEEQGFQTGRDALRGFNQGLYWRGSDEVAGAGRASPAGDMPGQLGAAIDTERAENQAAQARSPYAYPIAEALGFVPGAMLGGARAGAQTLASLVPRAQTALSSAMPMIQGMVQGALGSDSDDPRQTATDAATGGMWGVGGDVFARGVMPAMRYLGKKADDWGLTLRRSNAGGTAPQLNTLRDQRGIDYMEQGVDRGAENLGLFDEGYNIRGKERLRGYKPQSASDVYRKLGPEEGQPGIIKDQGERLGRSLENAGEQGLRGDWQNVEDAINTDAAELRRSAPVPSDKTLAEAAQREYIAANKLPQAPRAVRVNATHQPVPPQPPAAPPAFPPGQPMMPQMRETNALITPPPEPPPPAAPRLPPQAGPNGPNQSRRWWTDEQGWHGPAPEDPGYIVPPAPQGIRGLRKPNYLPAPAGTGLPEGTPPDYPGPRPPEGPVMQASSRELARTPPAPPPPPPSYGPFDPITTPPPRGDALALAPEDALRRGRLPPPLPKRPPPAPMPPTALVPRRLATPRELHAQKVEFEKAGDFPKGKIAPLSEEITAAANRGAANPTRDELHSVMEGADLDTHSNFLGANNALQDAHVMADMAGPRAATNRAGVTTPNPWVIGSSLAGAGAGYATEGIPGALGGLLAGYAANAGVRNYGQDVAGIAMRKLGPTLANELSIGAGSAAKVAPVAGSAAMGPTLAENALTELRSGGERLGSYRDKIAEAAGGPPGAVETLIARLTQTDPKFRTDVLPLLKKRGDF